jgi:hypothetical protein
LNDPRVEEHWARELLKMSTCLSVLNDVAFLLSTEVPQLVSAIRYTKFRPNTTSATKSNGVLLSGNPENKNSQNHPWRSLVVPGTLSLCII